MDTNPGFELVRVTIGVNLKNKSSKLQPILTSSNIEAENGHFHGPRAVFPMFIFPSKRYIETLSI